MSRPTRIAKALDFSGDLAQQDSQQLAQDIASVVNGLAIPQDAKLVRDIVVGTGPVTFTVKHRLRRKYTGWCIHRIRTGTASGIVELAQDHALDDIQVTFTNVSGSSNTVVDILFY